MKKAIFYTESCGIDKQNEFESCRGEGRIAINTAFGFSLLGYECYIINEYKIMKPKKIWSNVYIINKPDENIIYDIAFSWDIEHLKNKQNFIHKILVSYADTPKLLKIIKDENLDIILTCNVPCMMHDPTHYNYQNTQYLPAIFPISSVNKGFLPFIFEPKLPELKVLMYHSTWEHSIARSQYYTHKQKLILDLLCQKYKVNLQILVANDVVARTCPLIYNLLKCNEVYYVNNESLRYDDIIKLILNNDLCISVGAIFMPGPLVGDILSLGKPMLYVMEGAPSTTQFNNNDLCKCKNYIIASSETDVISTKKINEQLNNLEIPFNCYRKTLEDYNFKNWKKIVEAFLTKNCNYNSVNKINVKEINMIPQKNIFGDKINWDTHVNEILTALDENESKIYYTKDNEKIDKLKQYKTSGKVLDCGCHIGRWIEVFRQNGYDYTGVDQSEIALETFKKYKPDANVVNSLLWNMPFDNEFDIVHFNAVIQHNKLEEQEKIIQKVNKSLKMDGILIIAESTVHKETATQRTYKGWITFIESHGFKFMESWHKNELDLEDNYIFVKISNEKTEIPKIKYSIPLESKNTSKLILEKLLHKNEIVSNHSLYYKNKSEQLENKAIQSVKGNKNYNVFYCTICQTPEESLPNAQKVKLYVDEIIIVHNQKKINEQVKAEFDELGATLHYIDWEECKENFSYKRTQYIKKSGEIARIKGYDSKKLWMLITDSDEFPSLSVLQNLDSIITKAELNSSTICTINSHDYIIKGEGTANPFTFIPRQLEDIDKKEIITGLVSNYHKELFVKYQDKLEYKGHVHHTLHGSGLRISQLPKEYYYDHIKTDADLHSHGCRNWFIGGGGVQEFSAKWKELRSITDKYGFDTWEKMEKAMKIGNIPSDIKQFFIDHRNDNDRHTDSELRSFYALYKILHSRELVSTIQSVKSIVTKEGIKDPECVSDDGKLYQFIESEYLRILGTNADPIKAKKYITEINNGKMEKEDVTSILSHQTPTKNIFPTKIMNESITELSSMGSETYNSFIKAREDKFISPKINLDNTNLDDINIEENELTKIPDEIKDKVINAYTKVLRRYPDDGGLLNYGIKMKYGKLTISQLEKILINSDEYKEKSIYFK